jgi:predicted RND superfamily exporter protein
MTIFDSYLGSVTSHPKRWALCLILATGIFGYLARDVRLDNNFAQLFGTDSDAEKYRRFYRETFGPDDGLLAAILVFDEPLDSKGVELIGSLSTLSSNLSEVDQVDSVTHTTVISSMDGMAVFTPVVGEDSILEGSVEERLKVALDSSLVGESLLTPDFTTFLVVARANLEFDSFETLEPVARNFQALCEKTVEESNLNAKVYFAGLPFSRIAAISGMQGELIRLAPFTAFILCVFLFLFFRRIDAVVLPLLCMGMGNIITAALIGVRNDNLNQITVIFPVLLMVVIVADATHLLHRYYEKRHEGLDKLGAIVDATRSVVRACLLTSVTTAVGFASLMTARMEVLHGFGLYLACGVFAAFLVVVSIIPVGLMLWPEKGIKGTNPPSQWMSGSSGKLDWLWYALTSNRGMAFCSLLGVALTISTIMFSQSIVFDFSMAAMLNEQHPISEGNRIAEERLGGLMPIEVSFKGEAGDFKRIENIRRLRECEEWLVNKGGLSGVVSLASMLEEIRKGLTGQEGLPETNEEVAQLLLLLENDSMELVERFSVDEYGHVRIQGDVVDLGAQHVVAMQDAFEPVAQNLFAGTSIKVRMTGEAPVAYRGMNTLSQELLYSVLTALIVVLFMIGVVFKSVRLMLASVLPNILPILIGLAAYGLSGEVIDPLPGVVFCVALGISVDDTIHVFNRFQQALNVGTELREAIVVAMRELFGALVISTVVLMAGFLVLGTSDFGMNHKMGVLGGAMMLLALVCDFLFVPPMLMLFGTGAGKRKDVRG